MCESDKKISFSSAASSPPSLNRRGRAAGGGIRDLRTPGANNEKKELLQFHASSTCIAEKS